MQKILIAILFMHCLPAGTFAQSHKHQSNLTYSFDNAFMVISNEFALDTALHLSPTFVQPPYDNRVIDIYGPSLFVRIIPVQHATRLFFTDRINTEKLGVHISSVDGNIADTTDRVPALFDMNELQVQVSRQGKPEPGWQNVRDIGAPSSKENTGRPGFSVFADSIRPGEKIQLAFRNRLSGRILIRFRIERKTSTLVPYLAKSMHSYSADLSLISFSQKQFETKTKELGIIDTFYQYWPNRYSGNSIGPGTKHSKIALYFRKPSPSYQDTSLQFALTTGKIKDIRWQTTGHLLVLPDLKPGLSYTLFVRYKQNPIGIKAFTFQTEAEWYQSEEFKWAVGLGLGMSILLWLLVRYRIRLKNEKKKGSTLTRSLQSIRSQLNPHFVFNALSSIQGLINKNDIVSANHYLTEFSILLRETLKNSDTEFIPLDKELRLLETYLKLEQLRFQFSYTIRIKDRIDRNSIDIPSLLLQPLVENAIKHGAGPLGEEGNILIDITAVDSTLIIAITDNGKGFDHLTVSENGFGIRLTKERIELLNHTLQHQHIGLAIPGGATGGTTVHLVFKNWL